MLVEGFLAAGLVTLLPPLGVTIFKALACALLVSIVFELFALLHRRFDEPLGLELGLEQDALGGLLDVGHREGLGSGAEVGCADDAHGNCRLPISNCRLKQATTGLPSSIGNRQLAIGNSSHHHFLLSATPGE